MKKYILLIALNLFAAVYSFLYIIDFFNHRLIEGYGLVFSGIVFCFICLPFLIYFSARKKMWEARFVGIMMGSYFIAGFTGPKISMFLGTILAVIFLSILLTRKV